MKSDEFENKITISLSSCCWVDGLQRLIKLREKALPEVIEWCYKVIQEDNIDIDDDESILSQMIQLMFMINEICNGNNEDDNFDHEFAAHVHCHLLHIDDQEHLPIPVFFFISPTISTSFLLHVMLSMGRFETEIVY